jgi:glycine/D-amino acid oxidase-like deaminating enzyme
MPGADCGRVGALCPTQRQGAIARHALRFDIAIRLACQTTITGDVTLRRLVLNDADVAVTSQLRPRAIPGIVGQEQRLAMLFADIRGFTPFAEPLADGATGLGKTIGTPRNACYGDPVGTIYTRVAAVSAEGFRGPSSPTLRFDITYAASIPAAPALLAPADGAQVAMPLSFDWTDGIAGLTTAYLLAREGKSVIVLDDGPIGGGATGRTTAHLVTALDDRYFELERLHGPKGAELAAQSHSAAIDRIEAIVAHEGIACAFERLDGYLFVPPSDSTNVLDHELAATHWAGLTNVERLPRAPLPFFDTGPCLRFPRQAQLHPLKYLAGLAKAIVRNGGQIFTHTHADTIEGGSPGRVMTSTDLSITAEALVVATNTPVNDRLVIHTKQAPYRTYVIGARVPRGTISKGLYWDTPDPYHYVRLASVAPESASSGETTAYDTLIVGGENHKTGQADNADERNARLEAWTREQFPMVDAIVFRWSGQVMEPVDGLAFIGANPLDAANVYIATGDSGNGMTHGTIAGILLTDLILGRSNAWASLYNPSRVTLRAAGEFARENLNVAAQYADWMTAGDVDSPNEVAPGMGAILRRGLAKVAVYRDEAGVYHAFSAECPTGMRGQLELPREDVGLPLPRLRV